MYEGFVKYNEKIFCGILWNRPMSSVDRPSFLGTAQRGELQNLSLKILRTKTRAAATDGKCKVRITSQTLNRSTREGKETPAVSHEEPLKS